MLKKIFITGGSGYVGSVLTPYLLENDFHITVYDLFIYGDTIKNHKNLKLIKGDIRDKKKLKTVLPGHDAVIHLACISNDPSFELNPKLGREINLDAFEPLVKISRACKVKRFIYASSSSVYGIKDCKDVSEEMQLEPLTDYSKYKADCELILQNYNDVDFVTTTLRPATVCGYSPRQRLDLVVNILSNLGYFKREITVFGGSQLRPNIHILDMVRAYKLLLEIDSKKINNKVFNVGFENHSVENLANIVKSVIDDKIKLVKVETDDNRSYHISSSKIKNELNFEPKKTIKDAVVDLKNAFDQKLLVSTFENEYYFNIKRMSNIKLV